MLHPKTKRKGPAFICVGPERTGTSWLYANLQPHPDIFLPPVKEIRYFYEVLAYPNEGWRSRFSIKGDWHNKDYRLYLRERVYSYIAHPTSIVREWYRFKWDWRYLFAQHNDNWYLSLFDRAGDRLAGEISPQYFSLPEDQIRRMRELLPDLKIIILLRDPIDWSWSFARMTVIGNRSFKDISDEEFFSFFERYKKYYTTLNDIKKWEKYFQPDHLHIGFYDMLVESPCTFYDEICNFLKIDKQSTPKEVLTNLSKKVNEGDAIALPHRFALYLAHLWQGEIEQLCLVFEPYPQRWKQRCIEILAST